MLTQRMQVQNAPNVLRTCNIESSAAQQISSDQPFVGALVSQSRSVIRYFNPKTEMRINPLFEFGLPELVLDYAPWRDVTKNDPESALPRTCTIHTEWRSNMFSKILVAATALAAVAATSAYAANEADVLPKDNAEFTKWGEVEGWTVFVDQSRGTCLIERVDANTNVVQMGLTKSQDFGYLGVFTKADVKPKDNKVHLLLDGKAYYGDTSAKTRNLADGYKGGYILANNPDFVDDVMKKYTMSVYPEDANSFEVSLDGTFRAIEAARKCNAEQSK